MVYERKCKTCGEKLTISNEIRRMDKRNVGSTEPEKYTVNQVDGGEIIKKVVGTVSLGRVHDKGQYFCSEECYNKHEVPRKL